MSHVVGPEHTEEGVDDPGRRFRPLKEELPHALVHSHAQSLLAGSWLS